MLISTMNNPWTTIPSDRIIEKTASNLKENGITPIVLASSKVALDHIKTLVPKGASVMNGASVTLKENGYMDYLESGKHPWNNLHKNITGENDPLKRAELRKKAAFADYYLGSAHAVSETGEFLVASNTGSQLPHLVFTSPHLILVVGAQKIVPTVPDAFKRLEEYVVPLEDERMIEEYGSGTMLSKILLFRKENPFMKRDVKMIIVKEPLGF